MSGPVRIIDAKGTYPNHLITPIQEQRLWKEGRLYNLDKHNSTFVFGSNEAGRHGAGAARYAAQFRNAEYGIGHGPTGSCYALPTKDTMVKTLELDVIKAYVDAFIDYAKRNPGEMFQVTQIGCGLAGYKPERIAPLFKNAPSNCFFDFAWEPFLPQTARFWGNL
jgi:hypothetical protein